MRSTYKVSSVNRQCAAIAKLFASLLSLPYDLLIHNKAETPDEDFGFLILSVFPFSGSMPGCLSCGLYYCKRQFYDPFLA